MAHRPARTPDQRPHQRALIDQVTEELRRRGMSRSELGRQTGIQPSTLVRIFMCTRDMTVEQWGAIRGVLGMDPLGVGVEPARPAGGVAWISTPHGLDGLQQVRIALGRMYDDGDLRLAATDGGYWVVRR